MLQVINGGTSIGHCMSTLLSIIHEHFGVSEFDITTVQAAADGNTVDAVVSDQDSDENMNMRLGRADHNIIPFHNNKAIKEIQKVG